MSKPHKDMLAYVICSCLSTSSSSADVCWVDLFRTSTELSISKYGGLKCLPLCDVGNFCWIIRIGILGFEVSPPICGCQVVELGFEVSPSICEYLVFYLGFKVSPPVCRYLVVYLRFEVSPSICGYLVVYLGFEVSPPICGC